MTYRERREAKADQLQMWGEARVSSAVATVTEVDGVFHDDIALQTQPGHIPYRAKLIAREDRAFQSWEKGERMQQRAAGIESQLAGAIYSDDADAVDQLQARISKLEAKREARKEHNREHRGGKHCTCPPECVCRTRFGYLRTNECSCPKHPLPSYALTNLGAEIRRNQQRLELLKRQATAPQSFPARPMEARFSSSCSVCGETMAKGSPIYYRKADRTAWHQAHGAEGAVS